uniref:Uncharacterized protein n=1 Tax=uncultured marine virus TaxID=186617 RepID=A0A0F7L436_9VIRU|nr:hypothetical protein [uncultured marine virus]
MRYTSLAFDFKVQRTRFRLGRVANIKQLAIPNDSIFWLYVATVTHNKQICALCVYTVKFSHFTA